MIPTSRSAFIDYLRCAAFISVFAQHVLVDEIERLAHLPGDASAGIFAWLDRSVRIDGAPGVFGVVLFFMISGYCIAHAARRESARRFAVRRVLRIYPLLLVALVTELMLVRSGVFDAPQPTWREFMGSATLAGDFFGVAPRLAGVEWTLRLEFLFYVTIGLWLIVRDLSSKGREGMAPLPPYLAALAFIALMPAFPSDLWTRGYINMFAPFLIVGMAFAAFERGRLTPTTFALLLLTCLVTSWWTQHAIRPDYGRFQGYYAVAVVLFGLAWHRRNLIGASVVIYRVALLTYATYLFHGFLVRAIERALTKVLPGGDVRLHGVIGANDVLAIVLFFALMVALVALVEQPLVRWSKRLAS